MLSKKVILFDSILLAALSVFASASGLVFQIILSRKYGLGHESDLYFLSIGIPSFLAALFSTALSYAAVPVLAQTEGGSHRVGSNIAMEKFARTASFSFFLISLPAALLQPRLLPNIVAGDAMFSTAQFTVAFCWLASGVQILTALEIAKLLAARRAVVATLLALPPTLVGSAWLVATDFSVASAAFGLFVGNLAAFALAYWCVSSKGRVVTGYSESLSPPLKLSDALWASVSVSVFSAYTIIDAILAPHAGPGTLTTLAIAQRLIIGLGGIIITGPSALIIPILSQKLRDKDAKEFLRITATTAILVALAAVPIVIVLYSYGFEIVKILFFYPCGTCGEARATSQTIITMLPGFVAMMVAVIVTRAAHFLPFAARKISAVSAIWCTFYLIIALIFLEKGSIGFAVSYSVSWIAYLICMIALIYHSLFKSEKRYFTNE